VSFPDYHGNAETPHYATTPSVVRSGDTVFLPMLQQVGYVQHCSCLSSESARPSDERLALPEHDAPLELHHAFPAQNQLKRRASAPASSSLFEQSQSAGSTPFRRAASIGVSELEPSLQEMQKKPPVQNNPMYSSTVAAGEQKLQRRKGAWSNQELEALKRAVEANRVSDVEGAGDGCSVDWVAVASSLGRTRSAKQCRERWTNHHEPDESSKVPWTASEKNFIWEQLLSGANQWTSVASQLTNPPRTGSQVKNLAHSLMRQKRRYGADRIDHSIKQLVREEEEGQQKQQNSNDNTEEEMNNQDSANTYSSTGDAGNTALSNMITRAINDTSMTE
jgi:hypothetical protein